MKDEPHNKHPSDNDGGKEIDGFQKIESELDTEKNEVSSSPIPFKQDIPIETPGEKSTSLTKGANPQAEDGHVDIANEIVEALAKRYFSSYESQILWVIFRKTYGWHKKTDQISITQFQEMTGMKRRHVHRTLSKLVQRKIVTRIGNSRIISYGFQKDYTKWKDITQIGNDVELSRVSGQGRKKIVTQIGNRSLPKQVPTKETNKRNIFVEGSNELRLSTLLLEEIRKNKSDFKQPNQPNLQSWAKEVDLMIRRDGRKPERIEAVIRWCQKDPFWWKNVLSTEKLRDKFERLEAEMEEKKTSFKTERPQVEYEDFTGTGQR